MTQKKIISVTCPACCEEGDFRIYPTVDISQNAELKESIFNRELFKFTCPECGEEILVSYSCTYIDRDNGFVVALVTEEDNPKIEAEGCTLRLVRSINEFVEKIALMEDGIDDRIAELYKLMLEDQFEEERQGTEILGIYYGGQNPEDRSLVFYIITGNAENCRAVLSFDVYEAIAKQFDLVAKASAESSEINRDWALEALKDGFTEK